MFYISWINKWQKIYTGVTGRRPVVANWGGGMSVCCTAGLIILGRAIDGRVMGRGIIGSSHFQECKSASGQESDSCKQRYSKYPTFTFYI